MDTLLVMNYDENSSLDQIQFNSFDESSKEFLSENDSWNSSPILMPDSPSSSPNSLNVITTTGYSISPQLDSPIPNTTNGLSLQIPAQFSNHFFNQPESPFFTPETAYPYSAINMPHVPLFINTFSQSPITMNEAPKSAPPTAFRMGETIGPKKVKTKKKSKKSSPSMPGSEVEEEVELVCPHENCGKVFSKQFNLKSHLRSHATERTFACDSCDASFRRSHDLKRHFRSLHTVVKPYGCQTCGKRFARTDALKRHVSRPNSQCHLPKM